jgi:hypothetical protein
MAGLVHEGLVKLRDAFDHCVGVESFAGYATTHLAN